MKRTAIALALTGIAAAGLLLAAQVNTDYNHSADFARYHTYSWINVKATDDLWRDRITQAVDGQLTAKGWQRTDNGGDASVSAFAATHNRQTLNTFYDGFGGGWFWRGFGGDGMATTTVENTPVGSLVVDIFDSQSKHLIWRGRATDALSSKPEKNEKKLESAVKEMFEHFPPKSRG